MGSIGSDTKGSQEFTPHLYPPFPHETKPCANLQTFIFSKLLSADSSEHSRLYDVCKTQGFFYLDMTDTFAASLPEDAESIAHLSESFFKFSSEEKMEYSYVKAGKLLLGYKQAHIGRVDSKGTTDTAEFFNCSKDTILENSGYQRNVLHPVFSTPSSRSSLGGYQKTCHKLGLDLLNILGSQLGVAPDAFNDRHRITELAGDHIRITRSPPRKSLDLSDVEISVPGHTDFGTITILFNWMGGLQVWSEPSRGNFHNVDDPDTGTESSTHQQWLWVKPKPGHAIINLGDAAVKFTGGVLCSGRHRVVPAPGEQSLCPRYSVVYFVRPEDKCVLKRLEGREIPPLKDFEEAENVTAVEWIQKQVNGLRAKNLAEEGPKAES